MSHHGNKLRAAADAFETLYGGYVETAAQHIAFDVSGDVTEVHVHGAMPSTLDRLTEYDDADTSYDADGVLRRVSLVTDDLDVTWYRR